MSQSPFSEAISKLKPKEKEPRSARVLDGWVAQAQQTIGGETSGGRLGWLQIAQKFHACTDPHDPPAAINDRPRDVVNLLLLRDLARTEGRPTLLELRVATEAIFAARAADARALGRTERTWPCAVVAHEHWRADFATARVGSYVHVTLEDAVAAVNTWINQIAAAT